jgi:DNA-binding transcriptional ArsR family regulator
MARKRKGKRDSMKKPLALDRRLALALNHPLRSEILVALHDRVASPNELHRELKVPLSNVAYHVRVLEKLDCIELVETQPVRGSTEHFYRASKMAFLDDESWRLLNDETRSSISISTIREGFELVRAALLAGTFDKRKERQAINHKMSLDEQGWEELHEAAIDWYERTREINAKCANRTPDPAARFTAIGSLFGYEAAAPGKEKRGRG